MTAIRVELDLKLTNPAMQEASARAIGLIVAAREGDQMLNLMATDVLEWIFVREGDETEIEAAGYVAGALAIIAVAAFEILAKETGRPFESIISDAAQAIRGPG